MERPDTLTRIGRFVAGCAIGGAFLWFLYKIRVVLFLLAAGVALAYALDPLVKRFSANRPRLRPLGIALAYLTVFVGLGLAGVLGFRPVVDDVLGFAATLPASMQRFDAWLTTTSVRLRQSLPPGIQPQLRHATSDITARVESLASNLGQYLAGVTGAGMSFINIVTAAILVFVISALVLGDKAFLRRQLVWVIPTAFQSDADALLGELDIVLAAYVRGQIVVAVVVGLVATLVMWLMGLRYFMILGLFTTVTQFIPVVGGALALIAAVALAALQGPLLAVEVFVLYMILYQVSGNVLGPWIMGKAVKLHPLVILLATIVGTVLGGVVGLLLSVPVAAVLKVVWNFFYPRLAPQWRLGPSVESHAPAMPLDHDADPAASLPRKE